MVVSGKICNLFSNSDYTSNRELQIFGAEVDTQCESKKKIQSRLEHAKSAIDSCLAYGFWFLNRNKK